MSKVAKQVLVLWRSEGLNIGKDTDKNGNLFEYPIVDEKSLDKISKYNITDTLNRMFKTDLRNVANADKGIEARIKAIYALSRLEQSDRDRLGKAFFTRCESPKAVADELEAKYGIE
jgi:hypothetical protein